MLREVCLYIRQERGNRGSSSLLLNKIFNNKKDVYLLFGSLGIKGKLFELQGQTWSPYIHKNITQKLAKFSNKVEQIKDKNR